ncbi:hypothetical protein [Micromonospora sp. NPDC002717]|uniref:hypothetical protein n=1 Tax=Micromonospora sp. NPDC002717 TaxID=3154424 RepID=UPI00332D037B
MSEPVVVGLDVGVRPPGRPAENLDVFDFQLTDDEMTRIATLDTDASVAFDHRDPKMVSQIGGIRLS